MIFDPYKTRHRAFEPDMLKFYLGTQYDAQRPTGNGGNDQVFNCVEAWLFGLHN